MANNDVLKGTTNAIPGTVNWAQADGTMTIQGGKVGVLVNPPAQTLDVAGRIQCFNLQILGAQPNKMIVQSNLGFWTLVANETNLRNVLTNNLVTYFDGNYETSNGGIIQLPPGEIDLTMASPLPVRARVEIRGAVQGGGYTTANVGTTIQMGNSTTHNDGFDVIQIRGDGVRLVGLHITRFTKITNDATAQQVGGSGVDTNGYQAPYIDRCVIENHKYGIYNSKPDSTPDDSPKWTRDMQVLNGAIQNCGVYGIKFDSPAPGTTPYQDAKANSLFMFNMVVGQIWNGGSETTGTGAGIAINGFQKNNMKDGGSFILSTTMHAFRGYGIHMSGVGFFVQNVQVYGAQNNGIFVDRCREVKIFHSWVSLAGLKYPKNPDGTMAPTMENINGIRIESARTDSSIVNENIEVTNCTVMLCGGAGAHVVSSDPGKLSRHLSINNNTFHSNALAPGLGDMDRTGIRVTGSLANVATPTTSDLLMVIGNRSYNNNTAITDAVALLSFYPPLLPPIPPNLPLDPQKYGFTYAEPTGSSAKPAPTNGWFVAGNIFYDAAFVTPSIQTNGADPGTPPANINLSSNIVN